MANPLVECVPNFSEGRRPEVIEAIVKAISSAAPVRILDSSSDTDHNRTVVTFVGTPEAVEQAAFAGIKTAAALIDMDVHRGQHPRLGATDVVPFIPIRDISMDECVAMVRRLGARVGDELKIPVFFYEAAATRPDRENLENVRRGEYEGLKAAISSDPNRKPDAGPTELSKAGATIIGARPPLVAYNIYLNTADVEIAKKIAKAVRHSSGGLRYVKALGLLVEGKAQVSMNLTNFERTPIHRVQEMVKREAERYGVGIAHSELIGLIPENALIDAAQWYLQLDVFNTEQILERKLISAPEPTPATPPSVPEPPRPEGATLMSSVTSATVVSSRGGPQAASPAGFVEEVAQGTPTPGGGAVSALVGALAAALAEMVGKLTVGKKRYASVESEMRTAATNAESLCKKLLEAVTQDTAAFNAVMAANRLDKTNPVREGEIQAALFGAANVPLDVMRLSLEAMRIARVVAEKGSLSAVSDAAVGVYLALAAIEGAGLNVRVNALGITDRDAASHFRSLSASLLENARSLSAEAIAVAEARAGLK